MRGESQASDLRGSSSEAQCLVSFRIDDQFVTTIASHSTPAVQQTLIDAFNAGGHNPMVFLYPKKEK